MNWETLQSLDWQSVITAIITSTIFQSAVTIILIKLLGRIGVNSKNIDLTAGNIVQGVTEIAVSHKSLTDKLDDTKEMVKQNVKADAELNALLVEGTDLLKEKIAMLKDLKSVIETYKKEV